MRGGGGGGGGLEGVEVYIPISDAEPPGLFWFEFWAVEGGVEDQGGLGEVERASVQSLAWENGGRGGVEDDGDGGEDEVGRQRREEGERLGRARARGGVCRAVDDGR